MLKRKNKNIDAALADAKRLVEEAESKNAETMNRVEKVLKKFNISYTKSVGGCTIRFSLMELHYVNMEKREVNIDYVLFDFDDECQIMSVDMTCREVNERQIIYVTYEDFISTYILEYVNRETM